MGIAKKTDGRYVVGVGVDNANDYKGSAAYRDIYIQLTSSGATAKSEEYLTFLKDYAVNANASGEPIMPPSVNVWISNNGVTTAVEADDVSIDGNNYTICGIKWNGSTWDYSGAGQGKSGSGLPPYTSDDNGKVLTIGEGEGSVTTVIVPEQTVTYETGAGTLSDTDFSGVSVGDVATMTVNGVTEEVTAVDANGVIGFAMSSRIAIVHIPDGTTILEAPPSTYTVSLVKTVPSVEPKWEGVGGYIHNASRAFESGVMGLLQTAVTTLVQNNKTYAEAYGVILADDDSAAVLAMAQNPTRVNVWHALNQDFVVLRSNDNGNDNGSITVVLPYYEQVVATTLTYFLSITFTMNSSKSCYVRVFVLGTSGTSGTSGTIA